MLRAMIAAGPAVGIQCRAVSKPTGAEWLMTWGLGHPVRRLMTTAHLKSGGRVIGWDMAYWQRDKAMRVTLDDDHPHKWIRPEPSNRFAASNIKLREDCNPRGPVVLIGLGPKQRRMKGYQGRSWEDSQLKRLRARFPGKQIVYRPKKAELPMPGTISMAGDIETCLRGASLVVTEHSNVAVDACIAGIPVECTDGAAYALYRHNPSPSREQRLEFLQSLAWWQWQPSEAVEAWSYIKERLTCG